MILLLALLLAAPKDPAHSLARRVQHFYAHTKDFSAKFAQHYSYVAMGRTEDSSGTVQVKKPGSVRWDYQKPDKRTLYVEGKTLWIWRPDDQEAQVKRNFGGDQLSSAFTFLWGKGDLLKEFAPKAIATPDGGGYDEAAFGYVDFIEQPPKSELADEAMYRRGQALARAGRLEEAQTALQEFLEKHPVSRFKDAAALELQLVQAKLARNQEAAQSLQKSVDEQRAREKAESTPRGEQLRAAARARESGGSSDEWDAALTQAPAPEVARLVAELDKRSPAWPAA